MNWQMPLRDTELGLDMELSFLPGFITEVIGRDDQRDVLNTRKLGRCGIHVKMQKLAYAKQSSHEIGER